MGDYLASAERRVRDAQVRASAAKRTQKLALGLGTVIAVALVATLWFWSEARSALDQYGLLANGVRLREALEAESQLYPAWPEKIADLRAWVEDTARPLEQKLPHLEATLAELQLTGAAKEGVVGEPKDYVFEEKSTQFKYDNLAALVASLHDFVDPANGALHAVARRLEWAETIEDLSIRRYAAEWATAREAIAKADGVVASELYAEVPIDLAPQMGLVPIGMNPVTKLWEFYHLRSGWDPRSRVRPSEVPIPQHQRDGSIRVFDETGLVFVLVPGGTFTMGAQKADPSGRYYDPHADDRELPLHEVPLDPYFLSRYEMTQAQWLRLSGGEEPSLYRSGRSVGSTPIIGSNPVENVSWVQCSELLPHHSLDLPTEAQWERACRAGTDTIWSSGREVGSLQGYANIADVAASKVGVSEVDEAIDDGYPVHSPAGTFRHNPFGFYDMHGNVWEWCRDHGGKYLDAAPREGDGLRMHANTTRVNRGGSFAFTAVHARSANRFLDTPNTADGNLGLRPIRVMMQTGER